MVTLKGIIPTSDLQCWQLFVSACSILCSKLISKRDVDLADQYLLMFCRKFQVLYGPESCTPNMHLHLHLKDCVLDYGPVYSFWLFAFERFNGILGAYNTNNRDIEVQIMGEFLQYQQATKMEIPSGFPQFTTILKTSNAGSLHQIMCDGKALLELKRLSTSLSTISSFEVQDFMKLLPPHSQQVFSAKDLNNLRDLHSFIQMH